MAFETWLIYLLAAIGLSLSPGPNGLLALTHGALHGRRMTLYTILGSCIGFIIVIALSMFGIGALLNAFPGLARNTGLALTAHRYNRPHRSSIKISRFAVSLGSSGGH